MPQLAAQIVVQRACEIVVVLARHAWILPVCRGIAVFTVACGAGLGFFLDLLERNRLGAERAGRNAARSKQGDAEGLCHCLVSGAQGYLAKLER
jgi:hypothetical protein